MNQEELNKVLPKSEVEELSIKAYKRSIKRKIVVAGLFVLTAAIVITYGLLNLVTQNALTVKTKADIEQLRLTLSESKNFEKEVNILRLGTSKALNEVTFLDIPSTIDDEGYEIQNTDFYSAFTFYVRNSGSVTYNYSMQMEITKQSDSYNKYIRVMIFENGNRDVYALKKNDGQSELLNDQYGSFTTPFVSDTILFNRSFPNFEPLQVNKYTVVIWLEGNDSDSDGSKEANDKIINGFCQLGITFTALNSVES